MVEITQNEKKAIKERYPDVHIVRTMKQDSKRHHYYMTEDRKPMEMLRRLRAAVETNTEKVGSNNGYRKKKRRV